MPEGNDAPHGSLRSWLLLAAPALLANACLPFVGVLPASPGPRGEPTVEQAAIERQPVCIGSSVASAGKRSDVLYYRAVATTEGLVAVGYFAIYSEERPWGNNWMTWSVLPALAIDMVYSRTFWVVPGLQRALYGAGDVEGFTIVYRPLGNGSLSIDHAIVDDGRERRHELSRAEVLAVDPGRPTIYSDVWSHQFSGRGARSRKDLVEDRCYQGDTIRPLPAAVARDFRIDDDRAPPAHVERVAGRRIDDVGDPGALGAAVTREARLRTPTVAAAMTRAQ
ncbi:MAG TPA: hypothetical protein VIF09_28055 [Polyangiaceae bacterium]|jgi:hypothetical protein